MSYIMEYSSGQWMPVLLAVYLSSLLRTPSLLTLGGAEWERESLGALHRLFSNCQNVVVNAVSATNPKHSTIRAALKKTNSVPARASKLPAGERCSELCDVNWHQSLCSN